MRTLDKLVNGVCVTTTDDHMWLAPFDPSSPDKWLQVGRSDEREIIPGWRRSVLLPLVPAFLLRPFRFLR